MLRQHNRRPELCLSCLKEERKRRRERNEGGSRREKGNAEGKETGSKGKKKEERNTGKKAGRKEWRRGSPLGKKVQDGWSIPVLDKVNWPAPWLWYLPVLECQTTALVRIVGVVLSSALVCTSNRRL